ncbi:hypothetical protein ABZ614_05870 [Streptomyces sp. NPDC013178]
MEVARKLGWTARATSRAPVPRRTPSLICPAPDISAARGLD